MLMCSIVTSAQSAPGYQACIFSKATLKRFSNVEHEPEAVIHPTEVHPQVEPF
jgi:hypothetical protein